MPPVEALCFMQMPYTKPLMAPLMMTGKMVSCPWALYCKSSVPLFCKNR